MKLIDKAAVVAEIENRIKETESMRPKFDQFWAGQISAFKGVLKILDTLEVKEIDLEKYYHEFLQKEWFGNLHVRTVSEMMAFTAKHFFELGLKVQKGVEV